MIAVRGVSKSFGPLRAVDNLSLEIYPGEYVALLGPNGAGKTTLLEMIEGLQKPDAGSIEICGMQYSRDAHHIRRRIGPAFQETRFPEKLRVIEALRLFAAFYGTEKKRAEEILKLVGLEEKKKAFIHTLSGGQRQRLVIGIALIHRPKILLLDEPTTGLDPHARREVWQILQELRRDGMTLLLTTHYMEEAEELCQRIVILFRGRILADGTLRELLSRHAGHEILEFRLKRQNRRLLSALHRLPGVSQCHIDAESGSGRLHAEDAARILPEFIRRVGRHNLAAFTARPLTLDDLFIQMTGRHLGD